LSIEVTDRGIVDIITEGAGRVDQEAKTKYKNSLMAILQNYINAMTGEEETGEIGFSGTERIGRL
jgi:hypothetical protein